MSVCVLLLFFLMIRRPPRSTRTDTLFPYTTLFRSRWGWRDWWALTAVLRVESRGVAVRWRRSLGHPGRSPPIGRSAHGLRDSQDSAHRVPVAEPAEEGEHAGHRLEEVGRDLTAELHGRLDGPRQRDVLDQGHEALLGLLADAAGDLPLALGDDPGRARAGHVAQGHGDVGGVDEHDVGVGHRGDHAVPADGHLPLADLALHLREIGRAQV